MKAHVCLSGFVLMLICLPGIASEPSPSKEINPQDSALYFMTPAFHTLDCEGVGSFDEGHVEEHAPQIFFQYDRDRNRRITQSEFLNRWKDDKASLRASIYAEMDLDDNKSVTPNELRIYALKATKLLDRDHDGEVTLAEMNMKKISRPADLRKQHEHLSLPNDQSGT